MRRSNETVMVAEVVPEIFILPEVGEVLYDRKMDLQIRVEATGEGDEPFGRLRIWGPDISVGDALTVLRGFLRPDATERVRERAVALNGGRMWHRL